MAQFQHGHPHRGS